MPAERLQKLLAQAGIASRRAAETLIAAGRVSVNGQLARLGDSADPAVDGIEVDGRPLAAPETVVHFAIHKPAGYLSSARDERGRRSVVHLVDVAPAAGRLWPAGRLDVDSEGLMLLTNDGAWANRVLHPRYGLEREYAALVDRPPHPDELAALLDGVELDDGPARLLAAHPAAQPREVARQAGETGTWLRVRVAEGRKREVRRILTAAGLEVRRLVRTRLGSLALSGLRPGQWRPLNEREVAALAGQAPIARTPPARRHGAPSHLTVAIDGPSGSGKSTIGYEVARRIGATFVDTGLMYRALTLGALERGIDPEDGDALGRLAQAVKIEVRRPRPRQTDRRETVLLDGRDVTHEARRPRVDRAVSAVSRHASVRAAMLDVQRNAARRGDTVMVGRDIGTVVLREASLKVFLTASAAVRAARRAAEMGRPDRLQRYLAEIEERDLADTGRPIAPLRKARGALVLDTGELGVDACVDAIVEHLPVAR
ncbi:MAG TPA: (d)CMP kinase [Candidatus Dormibacteraeota bacterium]|nr:(d)CMP kinase [Candidatus Dormibacteraeota bacterium]